MWLYPTQRDGSCGVRENLRLLPKHAHPTILEFLEGTHKYPAHETGDAGHGPHRDEDEAPTASISAQRGR
jgi:phospholipid/cholesterol/gamma-HCH transport system ATP-binding protein